MRFRSLEKWKNHSEMEGMIFFAQRAEELLFDFTADSYKPMALSAPFLCEEALQIINDINKGVLDKSNLVPILEELSWSISRDSVAKNLLDLPHESYILDPEKASINDLKIKLSVLGRTLDSYRYLDRCIELLNDSVRNNKKKSICKLSRLLFTCLINLGMSKYYLYTKTIDFFYIGQNPSQIFKIEQFLDFIEDIYPKSHSFEIYFWVSGLIDKVSESTQAFNIEILESLPDEIIHKARLGPLNFPDITYKKIAKIANFRALDCYSAKESAERMLGRLRDLYNLYHHKSKIEWDDRVLVIQCCDDNPRILFSQRRPIDKIEDERPEQASRKLNRLLRNIRLETESYEKFNRAVDFHSLSANSLDTENQLLNLWIGLETICPTHSDRAKISQIVVGLLPFMTILYTRRIITKLLKDLLLWNRRSTINILKKLPNSKQMSILEKICILLCCKSTEDLRIELYTALKDFHLLRFRFFTLAEVYSKPDKVSQLIEEHEKKVSWQIRRIYRSRNLLVHSGRRLQYLPSLVENAHDYFDQTIFIFIRMCIGTYAVNNIEQAFELAKVTRQCMKNNIESINTETFDEITALTLINDHEFMKVQN